MAIQDAKMMFSIGQALTSSGTTDSTNTISIGTGLDAFGDSIELDPGAQGDIWLNVLVTTDFATTGSTTTLSVALHDAGGAILTSSTITCGDSCENLTAGTRIWRTTIPAGTDVNTPLKLVYTITNTDFSAGKVDAWLGLDSESEVQTS